MGPAPRRTVLAALLLASLATWSARRPPEANHDLAGITVLSDVPLDPSADARPGVRHPEAPIFRTAEDGWPLTSDAGYLALANEGPGFVYATWRDRDVRGGWPQDQGLENWGQIHVFSALTRMLREYRARRPEAEPIPIGHISGEHGGFPDLRGTGYSGHVTHQTGVHVNFRLVPREGAVGKLFARQLEDGEEADWDADAMVDLIDLAFEHGAHRIVTNGDVFDAERARAAARPQLSRLSAEPAPWGPKRYAYRMPDGRTIALFEEPRKHADHVNVVFVP